MGVRGLQLPEIENHGRLHISDDSEKLAGFVVALDPAVDADQSLAISPAFGINAYCHFDSFQSTIRAIFSRNHRSLQKTLDSNGLLAEEVEDSNSTKGAKGIISHPRVRNTAPAW